jgi:diguanylate cyclase (GGDEF)-like protein
MGTGRVARGDLLGRRFRFSLQTRILLVVLVCVVVPLLLMGAYLLEQTEVVLGAKARETVTNHLHRRVASLDAWVEQRMQEAKAWSSSFIVFEGVESLQRPGADKARVRQDITGYLEFVLGHYQVYESLFVVDLQGRVLASTRDEELEPWAASLLREQRPAGGAMTTLHLSTRLGRPTLLVVHDILSRGGKDPDDVPGVRAQQALGYFVGRIDLRALEAAVSAGADESEPDSWLLDQDGRILIERNRVAKEPGSQEFPVALPAQDQDKEPPAQAEEATLRELGPTVYCMRKLSSALGGYMVVTVSAAGAYRPVEESRARLLKAGIPAVLVIFLLAYVLARGMLRPILLLSEGAQRVSAGDLDVHLPVRGRDELADLTSAFNDMARRVREGRDELAQTASALARTNDQLEQAKERFRTQAITDGLTGLFNRRHFEDTLDEQIERAAAEGWPLSLLLLDLDHFKQYNDRWGHTEGDSELRRVAALVQRTVRSTDIAVRYGGEELAVLLPSCAKDQAVGVAEKVRQAVGSGTQRPSRFGARTTVSVGVATFPEDGRVARGLVDTADAALYQAKALGRDRVVAAGGPSTDGPAHGERATG